MSDPTTPTTPMPDADFEAPPPQVPIDKDHAYLVIDADKLEILLAGLKDADEAIAAITDGLQRGLLRYDQRFHIAKMIRLGVAFQQPEVPKPRMVGGESTTHRKPRAAKAAKAAKAKGAGSTA